MPNTILNGRDISNEPMLFSKVKKESAHKEIGNSKHILQQLYVKIKTSTIVQDVVSNNILPQGSNAGQALARKEIMKKIGLITVMALFFGCDYDNPESPKDIIYKTHMCNGHKVVVVRHFYDRYKSVLIAFVDDTVNSVTYPSAKTKKTVIIHN